MIITLAGPSAAGKGTLAKMLAEKEGLPHYDFGLMFRAIAFLHGKFSLAQLLLFAKDNKLRYEKCGAIWFKYNSGPIVLWEELKTEAVGLEAAQLAQKHLSTTIEIAQAMVKHESFVCDGRTCGSEIYPEADYKFFITADSDERLGRREGDDKEIRKVREATDRNRLVVPEGAIVINTTGKESQESLDEIQRHIKGSRHTAIASAREKDSVVGMQ